MPIYPNSYPVTGPLTRPQAVPIPQQAFNQAVAKGRADTQSRPVIFWNTKTEKVSLTAESVLDASRRRNYISFAELQRLDLESAMTAYGGQDILHSNGATEHPAGVVKLYLAFLPKDHGDKPPNVTWSGEPLEFVVSKQLMENVIVGGTTAYARMVADFHGHVPQGMLPWAPPSGGGYVTGA